MSGNKRFFLDTNAIIAFLNGNFALVSLIRDAEWLGISVINELEFLAFKGLSERDKVIFNQFKQRIEVIDIVNTDENLMLKIIEIRKKFKLKLPDAIVAASTICADAVLITQDAAFEMITDLDSITY
jgi:tRNA(fMet)-specific endonuclease VapC